MGRNMAEGTTVESGGRNYYETLGLRPGASLDEIRAAFKDMVKVWHPDRFHDDERLREKAEDKLKEINEAYQYLLAHPYTSDLYPEPPSDPEPPLDEPESVGAASPPRDQVYGRSGERPRTPGDEAARPRLKPRLARPPRRPRTHPMVSWSKVVALFVFGLAVLVLSVSVAPLVLGMLQEPAAVPPTDPAAGSSEHRGQDGVLLLVTLAPFRPPEYGTAFLIDHVTAMTASHVLISAARPRAHLLAVTPDHHAYRARILCRAPLGYHDYAGTEVAFSKDVALVGIDWDAPERPASMERFIAVPGALPPAIAPLHVSAAGPHPGDTVVIAGYGQQRRLTPELLRATGVVSQLMTAKDGAAVFSARLLTSMNQGEAGAPVLNTMGEVVGLWAWQTTNSDDDGAAVAAPSLSCP